MNTVHVLPRLPQTVLRTQYTDVNPTRKDTAVAALWATVWTVLIAADFIQTRYALTVGGYTEVSPVPAQVQATFGLSTMLVASVLFCMVAVVAPYAPWTRKTYVFAAWAGSILVLLGKLAVVLSNWHQLSG